MHIFRTQKVATSLRISVLFVVIYYTRGWAAVGTSGVVHLDLFGAFVSVSPVQKCCILGS
jgi:hypothetical protein